MPKPAIESQYPAVISYKLNKADILNGCPLLSVRKGGFAVDSRYNENGLTPNQQVFCDEYLRNRNATQAYLRAYPGVKNAEVASANGSRLLGNARVSTYVATQEALMHRETIADATEIREFLTSVMRGQEPDTVPLFVDRGIQELTESPPGINLRLRAAELLGKTRGIFSENVRVDVSGMPKLIRADDGSVELDAPD